MLARGAASIGLYVLTTIVLMAASLPETFIKRLEELSMSSSGRVIVMVWGSDWERIKPLSAYTVFARKSAMAPGKGRFLRAEFSWNDTGRRYGEKMNHFRSPIPSNPPI
jgi:hypothetical protein